MLERLRQSGRHTHRVERQNFHRQLRWSVAMATASLPLISASLFLSHSLTHSPSMSLSHVHKVSNFSCASPPPISLLSPPPSAYLKLIFFSSYSTRERLPSARACLAAALGEMKTDSRWHRGRRDADALTCPPTPTWDAHRHTQTHTRQTVTVDL